MVWTFIQKTAWPMTPPAPWSFFHIVFSLFGLVSVVFFTRLLIRPPLSDKKISMVLWRCGLILAVSEVYKQLFLYKIVNNCRYDWWYFPFQLCSTPMYLCLIFPLLPSGKVRRTAAVYLQSFGFLGGIMALIEPSGLMHPYWTLTLHGFVWHLLLIFIACFCTASGLAGEEDRSFLYTLPLFYIFCLIAMTINIVTRGTADMFYISPYYPITQIVFHEISLSLGIWPGIAVYLLAICTGAFLCRKMTAAVFNMYNKRSG
ncbi:MAG: YwaF family protein [Hungatella sp.]|nr:YwaF family protein [Hungatella sp.]